MSCEHNGPMRANLQIPMKRADGRAIDSLEAQNAKMREALILVRSIITDGAMTGFNPLDGDWADRLFKSQATTYAALNS